MILHNLGLLDKESRQRLAAPYPRVLGVEYADAIQALNDSSIIVNEGFAAWMELTFLSELSPIVGQAVYRRREYLLSRDDELADLQKHSPYFIKFPPFLPPSRYREGYEYFRLIHGYFGDQFGPKCVVQVFLKTTDINFGITENNGLISFGLSAAALRKYLLDESLADDARADMRLRRIHMVLRERQKEVWEKQRKLQCYRTCLHDECPVNEVIQNQLTW